MRAARAHLLASRARLAEIVPVSTVSGAGALSAEMRRRYEEQRLEIERAYETDQKILSQFLTAAVNDFSRAPETREGVLLYCDEAVRNARFLLDNKASREQAREQLRLAESLFRAIDAPLPATLVQLQGELGAAGAGRPAMPSPTAVSAPTQPVAAAP